MTSPSPTPLVLLRRLWLGVAAGVLVISVFVLVAADAESTVPAVLPMALTAAAGLAALVGVRAVDRLFAAAPPADDVAALLELRQRAYLAIGIAEAPVLLGVALAFVLGPRWTAVVGAVAGMSVLVAARPTLGRLARIEAAWQAAGKDVSLLRAVGAEPPHDDADDQEQP